MLAPIRGGRHTCLVRTDGGTAPRSSESIPSRMGGCLRVKGFERPKDRLFSSLPGGRSPLYLCLSSWLSSTSPITYFPSPHLATSPSNSHIATSPTIREEPSTLPSSLHDRAIASHRRFNMSNTSSPLLDAGTLPPVTGMSEHRKGTVPRQLSTPVGTSRLLDLGGLGLGDLPERRVHRDDALASPRRISTSRPMASSAYPSRSVTASPAGAPTLQIPTTNEPYYSQPPSASTPRFRPTPMAPPPASYGSLGVNLRPTRCDIGEKGR